MTPGEKAALNAHCAELIAIRDRSGVHATHTQRVSGHWLLCSCGARAVVAPRFEVR